MQSSKDSAGGDEAGKPTAFSYGDYLSSQLNRSLTKSTYDTSTQTEYLLAKLWPLLGKNRNPTFLCVGCRNGFELDKIERAGARSVVGIDLHSNDPRILVMDMHALEFPDATFDVVYSCHSLEHALDPEKVCREFGRVVKPGGFVVIEVPTAFHSQDLTGQPRWDAAVMTPAGKQVLVPRNDRGLVTDIWDLRDPSKLEQMLQPLKTSWSEAGCAILNPQQQVLRIISHKPGGSPLVDTTVQVAPASPARFTVVHPTRLSEEVLSTCSHDLNYSIRRYFVDEFYTRRIQEVPQGGQVLDLGGKRARKRGQFNIEKYPLRTKYVNLDPASDPDFLADVAAVPVPERTYDAVILAEVIEHLKEPVATLREAARVLRSGGVFLATAPFMYRIHPDPIDVARYLPQWWADQLSAFGFTDIEIEPQGLFFTTLVDLARDWVRDLSDRGALWKGSEGSVPMVLQMARKFAVSLEQQKSLQSQNVISEVSTGFGVRARRL